MDIFLDKKSLSLSFLDYKNPLQVRHYLEEQLKKENRCLSSFKIDEIEYLDVEIKTPIIYRCIEAESIALDHIFSKSILDVIQQIELFCIDLRNFAAGILSVPWTQSMEVYQKVTQKLSMLIELLVTLLEFLNAKKNKFAETFEMKLVELNESVQKMIGFSESANVADFSEYIELSLLRAFEEIKVFLNHILKKSC